MGGMIEGRGNPPHNEVPSPGPISDMHGIDIEALYNPRGEVGG